MSVLPDDWNEMSSEERCDFWESIQKEQEEAERSYQPGTKRVYCHLCGRLMKNGSVSFFEGYHVDTCF